MSKTCHDRDVYDQYKSNDVAISLFIIRLRAYSMIKAFLSIWPMKIFLLFMPLVVANPVLLYIEPANWRSGVPLGEMARTAWIGCTKLRLTDNRIHFKKACAFIKSIHLTQSRKYFFLCRCGTLSERQNEFKFVFVLRKSVSFAALHLLLFIYAKCTFIYVNSWNYTANIHSLALQWNSWTRTNFQ